MPPAHARLTVTRNSPRDIKIRGLEMFLDDKPLANLAFGESHSLEIEPGVHTLRVTNNLYAESAEFTIQAGEHSTFEVGNVVRGLGAVPFMLFGFGPYRVFLSDPEITRE